MEPRPSFRAGSDGRNAGGTRDLIRFPTTGGWHPHRPPPVAGKSATSPSLFRSGGKISHPMRQLLNGMPHARIQSAKFYHEDWLDSAPEGAKHAPLPHEGFQYPLQLAGTLKTAQAADSVCRPRPVREQAAGKRAGTRPQIWSKRPACWPGKSKR